MKISDIFSFVITIAVLIIVLKIIGWIPLLIQKDTMRKYSSIEEVSSQLNLKDVYMPSYFPKSIKWPPSGIYAQRKPFPAVVTEFKHADNGNVILIISQSAGTNFVFNKTIKILQIKEKVNYSLKSRPAVLEVGVCKNNEPCSRISWDEKTYRIIVVMESTPFELLKIAESMLR